MSCKTCPATAAARTGDGSSMGPTGRIFGGWQQLQDVPGQAIDMGAAQTNGGFAHLGRSSAGGGRTETRNRRLPSAGGEKRLCDLGRRATRVRLVTPLSRSASRFVPTCRASTSSPRTNSNARLARLILSEPPPYVRIAAGQTKRGARSGAAAPSYKNGPAIADGAKSWVAILRTPTVAGSGRSRLVSFSARVRLIGYERRDHPSRGGPFQMPVSAGRQRPSGYRR